MGMYSPSYSLNSFAPIFKLILGQTAPYSQSVKSARECAIFHDPVPPSREICVRSPSKDTPCRSLSTQGSHAPFINPQQWLQEWQSTLLITSLETKKPYLLKYNAVHRIEELVLGPTTLWIKRKMHTYRINEDGRKRSETYQNACL